MLQTRYQYYGPNGIAWTQWYRIPDHSPRFRWQLKNKLRQEYRTVT